MIKMKISEKYIIAEKFEALSFTNYYPVINEFGQSNWECDTLEEAEYDKSYLQPNYVNQLVIIKQTEEVIS